MEHDKRKEEILRQALDVFLQEGYYNATFQMIAERCNITRTTLYIYFKDKREIFRYSIKQFLCGIEQKLHDISQETSSPKDKLVCVLCCILDLFEHNERLFSVLLPYLISLKNMGKSPLVLVQRRTIKIRHFLSTIIIEGIKEGTFDST